MSRYLRRRTKKIGIPPGTLIYTGDDIEQHLEISAIAYDANHYERMDHLSLPRCQQILKNEQKKIWINVCGINDSNKISEIGKLFKLHPLLLEDIMNPIQRSKVEDYKNYLFIVSRILKLAKEKQGLEDEQFSLVVGQHYLITFIEKDSTVIQTVIERLKIADTRLRRRNVDYLAYCLLDSIVDNYFFYLETIDNRIEGLEETVLNHPKIRTLSDIQNAKREMAFLRKSIWPMREVINQLRKTDSTLISDGTKLFFYDVYDHIVQVIETIEGFRELISGMLDIYMSNINQRTNEIIRLLTIITTIFVPLTFIASLYGMNFENIPGLQSAWGFHVTLVLMLFSGVAMVYFFKKRQWL
ncbi:MAG: magnesium/cobalt transporter CorA [Parachlamydiaceae bacterium]